MPIYQPSSPSQPRRPARTHARTSPSVHPPLPKHHIYPENPPAPHLSIGPNKPARQQHKQHLSTQIYARPNRGRRSGRINRNGS
ncbi:hypothetical protein K505DRAFT_324755 [Melanomma pulvis-pyrius CBS 109.77]|uniref:Uncharacterized protein n=1 Tax=Melanomma pulvis-pyrius CBS 109.77 TaxID=1314802 RepID=A0A6A6XDD3_9PLEO|nr:hypothetical protein K505DRAFT_324755 [Melanomma pulvis-pyrius CBS 109.77]